MGTALSNFTFNFNLRRYSTGDLPAAAGRKLLDLGRGGGGGGSGGGGAGISVFDAVDGEGTAGSEMEAMESGMDTSASGGAGSLGVSTRGMRRLTATTAVNCSCSLRVAAECDVGFRGFRGLSDEITVHRRELSAADTRRMMFTPTSSAHSPPEGHAAPDTVGPVTNRSDHPSTIHTCANPCFLILMPPA
jgi:hypothetical protein